MEECFRKGLIFVLTATTTLAVGVNLPAHRVIIHSLKIGRDKLDVLHYKQMCGRAGRPGLCTEGESFLVVEECEKEYALQFSRQSFPEISSQLNPIRDGGNGVIVVILELFSLRLSYKT